MSVISGLQVSSRAVRGILRPLPPGRSRRRTVTKRDTRDAESVFTGPFGLRCVYFPRGSHGGPMDTIWMAEGNCAREKPTVFFPSDGVGVEVARRICATCPVKEPCLEYALEQRIDHGVWGGCSERERRRILKRRRDLAEMASR